MEVYALFATDSMLKEEYINASINKWKKNNIKKYSGLNDIKEFIQS